MSAADLDRGMRAVERVRAVRERDSRIGLQQALREREAHRARVQHLVGLLEDGSWQAGDTPAFTAARHAMLAVGDAIEAATEELAAAQRIADTAQAHWTSDKVRLSAVESLLARRAETRRAERSHREAVELDDIAGQLWARTHSTASHSPASHGAERHDPEADR